MSDSEFEPIGVINSGTIRPKVGRSAEKRKYLAANRSDSEESIAAADVTIPKQKKPNQKRKPSASRSAAPKKKTKNPFDVFGISPEEIAVSQKLAETDPLDSSIITRVPNGSTKRDCRLNGDFFFELRVYNTADIRGELRQERWKKALVTLKAQIDDETVEWEALQKFIKKINVLFKDANVKFYSNDPKY